MHSPHLPALHGERQAGQVVCSCCVCCETGQLLAVCFEACAGRRIRWLWLPAVALFCGLCACRVHSLPAMPTAHQHLAPVQFALPRPLCFACPRSLPCAPGSSSFSRAGSCLSVRASSLQAARLPRRQQQRGPAVAARAPCCVQCTVASAARLPLGSRHMETAFGQPMRRRRYP